MKSNQSDNLHLQLTSADIFGLLAECAADFASQCCERLLSDELEEN